MKWMCFLFFFGLVLDATNCNEDRIVHGEKAPDGLYQFLPDLENGELLRKEGYSVISFGMCSSTIISPRHILTNAHCVGGYNIRPYLPIMPILVNFLNIEYYDVNVSRIGIPSKVYIHRGYQRYIFNYNDIAILEFPEYVKFNITPVKLAKDYVDDYNDTAIAAGYGNYIYNATTNKVIDKAPTSLLHLKVGIHPFIPNCVGNFYIKNSKLLKSQMYNSNAKNKMCAGNIPMQRFDHGDSGGPLLFEKNNEIYQIGLVDSLLENPEDMMEKLGIYARISYYCPWIEKVTKQEVKCVSLYELPPPVPTPQPSRSVPTTKTPKPEQPTRMLPTPETSTKENSNDAMIFNSFGCLLFIVVFKLFI